MGWEAGGTRVGDLGSPEEGQDQHARPAPAAPCVAPRAGAALQTPRDKTGVGPGTPSAGPGEELRDAVPPSAAGHRHWPGLLGTSGTGVAPGELPGRQRGLAVLMLHRWELGCTQSSRCPDGKCSPAAGHRAGSALPREPKFLRDGWQEPKARRPRDGVAGPPPSSSVGAGRPFTWLIAGSLQTRRARWNRGVGSSHPPPRGTAPGIRNLGRLCPPWSWVPATTLRRSPPRSRLRPQIRRQRAGSVPLSPRRRPPPSAARDRQEEAAGLSGPVRSLFSRAGLGVRLPAQGRALPWGTHSTHPHHPAPPEAPGCIRARDVIYLVVSLQVLPGEVQHLLLGSRPVVVAHGFLGTGRERGLRQPLCCRQSQGTGAWGVLTGRGSKSSSCRRQRSRWKR